MSSGNGRLPESQPSSRMTGSGRRLRAAQLCKKELRYFTRVRDQTAIACALHDPIVCDCLTSNQPAKLVCFFLCLLPGLGITCVGPSLFLITPRCHSLHHLLPSTKSQRASLDDLDVARRDDEPSEYDCIETVENVVEEHDADVEGARAGMDDLELNNTPALPSINVQDPTDKPQSPAKKVCISTWLPCTFSPT